MIQGVGDTNGDKDSTQLQHSTQNGQENIEHSSLSEQSQVLQSQVTTLHGQRIALAQPLASAVIATPIPGASVGASTAGGVGNATYQHYLIPGVSLGGQIQNIAIPAQVTVSLQQTAVHAGGSEPSVTAPTSTYTISSPQSLARILAAATQGYTIRTAGTANTVSGISTTGVSQQQIQPQDTSSTLPVNVQNLQLQTSDTCTKVLTLPVSTSTMTQKTVLGTGSQDFAALQITSPSVTVHQSVHPQTLVLDSMSTPTVPPADVTRVHSYSLASASSNITTVSNRQGNTNANRTGLGSNSPHQKGISHVISQTSYSQNSGPHKRIVNSGAMTSVNTNTTNTVGISLSSVNNLTTLTTTGTPLISSSFPPFAMALSTSSATSRTSPKPKRVKLEEKPPANEEIANKRRKICDYRLCHMKIKQEKYREHMTELFFLQNGGNMMDFLAWRKRSVPQLLAFLRANALDSDEEHEQRLIADTKTTSSSVSSLLSTGSFLSTSPHNLPQGALASSEQKTQLKVLQSTATTSSSHSHVAVSRTNVTSPVSGSPKTAGNTTSPGSSSPSKSMKPTQVLTFSGNKFQTRQHSISAFYDSAIGSQEEIVERAKQEAYVMQRISELRKEGLWTMKRLPKIQEPPRSKAQWDYLLEEMVWLATDFAQERKWKKAAAKKCARMVMKYHQEMELKVEKAEKEEQQKLRKIAGQVAKEIKQFWSNIEKLVEYKQQTWFEEKRKKALDIHLNFIVDQTEKYSSWLTQGMNQGVKESTGTSITSSSLHESQPSSPAGSHGPSSNDEDFEPENSESDDEETIEREEAEGLNEEEQNQEIKLLQKESEVPLDELLKSLPREILEKPASPLLNVSSEEVDNLDEIAKVDKDININEDEDFSMVSEDDEEDDEATICEQEKKEKQEDYEMELKDLQNEAEVPIEELYKKYAEAYATDDDSEEEHCNEPDNESGEDVTDNENSDIESEDEMEDEIESSEDLVDVGMEFLLNSDENANDDKKVDEINVKEIKHEGPSKEITDIAAAAESFQPKGNTLSTTQVCTKVPFLLKHQLREYQHIGIDWLVAMHSRKLNGILADEMGLGKTIQTIALMAHLACDKTNWGPHLIVVPTSVMLNWEMEFKKWCPAFKILTYYGTPKERKQKRQGWTKPNAFHVCITSYKLVVQDHQSFRRKKWKYFVLDEAQHIKNFKSQRWQMLLNFQSSHRLLLTGTPLQNSLMELWSLMHFLMPNVFHSHKEFREWFANPVTGMIEGSHEYNESLIKRLHKVLRPFLLRRLKCEVEKQLPKKYEHVVLCRLSKRQRYLYDDFMSQTKTKETLASGNFMSVINVLMQLRKVCNHPNMFEPRPIVSPFMMEALCFFTSSLVWRVLEYDPFKHISLWALNLLLADLELCLTAFAAHRIKKFQTPSQLIQEIDSQPPSPPRCPPGKIRLHIRTSNPPNPPSGRSSPVCIQPRTPSPSPSGRTTTTPLVTRLPSISQTAVSPQRLLVMSGPNSVPSSRSASPSSLQNIAPSPNQQSEYTLQFIQTNPGGLPVTQFTSLGGQVVSSTPITVQIQQMGQGGGRLAMPLGIGRLVQTSSGQHLLLTPTVSGVATPDATHQVLSPVVSSAPLATSINTPSATIPTNVIFQTPAVSNAAAVLPQMNKIQTNSTIISTPVKTQSSCVTNPPGVSKPILKVAPLNVNVQTTSTNLTVSSNQPPKSPFVHSLGKPGAKSDSVQLPSVKTPRKSSLFYLESIASKREDIHKDHLKFLGQINSQKCAACPIYGRDLIEAVTVTESVKPCPKFRQWGEMGYVNCLNAPFAKDRPREYWFHSQSLQNLISTPESCLSDLKAVIERFVFVIPRVSTSQIQMHTSHPPPSKLNENFQQLQVLHHNLSPRCALLHPIINRTRTQFPELRLIQYDCGKLQTLDKLLWQLKSGFHRVLIFTQMTRMLDILEQFLNYHGHTYLRLDGNTRVDQRQALMERFNADKRIFCFILSTRSGGIGVNLTGADTVIFYDSDWNPTMDAQAQDRCHRIGQTRDVHIYRLISERTVEENILKKANQKRLLTDLAIEGGNFTTAFFKKNTIQELFDVQDALHSNKNEQPNKNRDESDEKEKTDLPEKFSQAQLEQALGMAEEENDVQAARTARAEAAAELAEFDETIPLDTDSRDNEEKSPAEEELDKLMDQLSPVERYAMQFLESLQEPFSLEQLKQAEEEIEAQKKDWELGRLKALKEEEERRASLLEDEEEPLLSYSRADAYNQVFISLNGQQQMPMWSPPTPPQDENDLYIDYSMGFLYEQSIMSESQLPSIYVKKEAKRIKIDPSIAVVTTRKQKVRKEETFHVPRSLFDRPTAAILKLRREAKLQKVKGLTVSGTTSPVSKPLGLGITTIKTTPMVVNKPTVDTQQDYPEWLIHEDWAVLQVIQTLQGLPLNLTVLSPAHIPNWDLVADSVNSVSRIFRSPKQCKNRYESVIVPREEGKILYDTNPKKQKKTKGIYKTKNNRPMRTSQLFIQDNNASFTSLYSSRFETIKSVANKRTPTLKPWFVSPAGKNPKHAAVLAESGINYDQPLSPVQVAAIRAERIAREKQKSQAAAAEQQLAAQRQQQQQQQQVQQSSVTAQVAGTTGLIQHQTAQAVIASLTQAQQLQAIQSNQLTKTGLQTGAVATVSLAKSLGNSIVVNTGAGTTPGTFSSISKALGQAGVNTVPSQGTVQSATVAALRTQRPAVTAASSTTTTMTVQEMVAAAAAAGQVRGLTTTAVTGSTTPAVVSVSGLTAVQLQAASQRISSGLGTVTTVSSGISTQTAATTARNLTPSQLQAFRQTALLRQQQRLQEHQQQLKQQQQLKRLHVAAQQQQQSPQAVGTKVAVSVNSPLTASVAAVAAAAAQQRAAAQQQQQQTVVKQARSMTEAEVAQLIKRQQQIQQQKQAAVAAAQLTTAQILAQAQLQQVQQQQQQQQQQIQQSLASAVQTPVATLVKTVSAPTTLGVTPVSAVTMAGVNINVNLPQAKAAGTVPKGTTAAATVTPQQYRQLQLQHQILQQRKFQHQQKVASLAQVAKGKSTASATALPNQLSTVQIVQHGTTQSSANQQGKAALQAATSTMTVQQIQQVIKQVSAAVQGTVTATVTPSVAQTQLLSHAVLQAATTTATAKPIAAVTLTQSSPSQTHTSVGIVTASPVSTASSIALPGTVQTRVIPISHATVSSPTGPVTSLTQPGVKQTIQVVTTPSLTTGLQTQQGIRAVSDTGLISGTVKPQAIVSHATMVSTQTVSSPTTSNAALLKGAPAVVVSGQPQTGAILQQVSPVTAGLTAQQAVTLAVRAAAASQGQAQPQVQLQVQQTPTQQPHMLPTVQSSQLPQTIQQVSAISQAAALGLGQTMAQTLSIPSASQTAPALLSSQPVPMEANQSLSSAQVSLPTIPTPPSQSSLPTGASANVPSATAQVVQAAIQAAKQQQAQAQAQQRASPYTMRLRNPPKQ